MCGGRALGLLFAVPFAMNFIGPDDAVVAASVAPDGVDAASTPSVAREAVIHQDAVPDVSPESLDLVHVEATAPSKPGQQLTVSTSKVLGAAGTWTFWPCYQIGDSLCPDE